MDFIFIRELRLEAWVGIYKHETLAPQTIELDLELALPGDAVFRSRKVGDTIDYAMVVKRLGELVKAEKFGLVEVLADRVAGIVMDEFHSPQVRVGITKLGVLREAKRVGVRIERSREATR